ncbi:MAG: hypothetical protein LBH92_02225 [Bacteroidales bacterium]|nr:hypothetical protein [Bacteroidales bacterium]
MMEPSEVIVRIEAKIKSIKDRVLALQAENKTLSEQVILLTKDLDAKKALISKYEQDQYIEQINNNNGSEKAKQIVEEMLREIDKCIVLLNK